MSLLWKLRLGKPRRSSLVRLLANGFSSSSSLETPPYSIINVDSSGGVSVTSATEPFLTKLEKKVPLDLTERGATIGASHGWVATLKDDGILRLQDDLNPNASDLHPKRISLPPLVTLPHSQTQVVTNVSLSCSSPEDEDCLVAVKFLGDQLSICRPAQSNSEWTNIRILNPCFHSSRVMFSKKDDMFRIPGSGGHVIGSWDLREHSKRPKLQHLLYRKLPKLTKAERELLDSCRRTEHLVESIPTGETFLIRWYKKTEPGLEMYTMASMKTVALMVFKLDDDGNAFYARDIGDLIIFLSNSEPFCVPESSYPHLIYNSVEVLDVDEYVIVDLEKSSVIHQYSSSHMTPYHIPPQSLV